jgi:hypothetical protein
LNKPRELDFLLEELLQPRACCPVGVAVVNEWVSSIVNTSY